MAYLKINGIDFSNCVSGIKVESAANFNAQTNAAGDTVVDYINNKRSIEVTIIPLTDTQMQTIQSAISGFQNNVSYINPTSGALETVYCILPSKNVEYFTIQTNRVLFKEFTLTFEEL